jgi:hypothetical protein
MTDRVCHICLVIEAATLKWMFEGGICDATREALVVRHHEEDDQMGHSQYQHFLNLARDGIDVVVILVQGRDHIGCLANEVKLAHALVRDLDEAVKEIQQLGNHGEEAGWKITELEALYK